MLVQGKGEGEHNDPWQSMLHFCYYVFHLIVEKYKEACGYIKGELPDQQRNNSLSENDYNKLILFLTL